MDATSASMLWYKRTAPLGKVKRRVQDLRIPSPSSYHNFPPSRPPLDLSHNEGARLAADSLLSHGLEGYHNVLKEEGEVDFLSEPEKIYFLKNGRGDSKVDSNGSDDNESGSLTADSQSATQCPETHTDSDSTLEDEEQSKLEDVKGTNGHLEESVISVHFQCDSRPAGMKDLVREFIRKANMALAIVTDSFSDVELLCDILEASRKRNVSVHLLLDQLNLNLFLSMWQDLRLDGKNFPRLSVHSVSGQTYCAKTGRKLTGQIAECFIISDWTEALTGSFSFTWLSWQVHRSLAVSLKGRGVVPFHQEFHRLFSSSKPVPGFVTYIKFPRAPPSSRAPQNHNSDANDTSESSPSKAASPESWDEDFLECGTGDIQPQQGAGSGTQIQERPPQLLAKPLVPLRALQTVPEENHSMGTSKTLNRTSTEIQCNPLNPVLYLRSQRDSLAIAAAAERNARGLESDPHYAASPTHRAQLYQSTRKTKPDPKHLNMAAEGLFFQQRDRLTKGTHWNVLQNLKPKLEVTSPPAAQQKPSTSPLWFSSAQHRGPTSGRQKTRPPPGPVRQDQPQMYHQTPLQSHQTTGAKGSKHAASLMGTYPKPLPPGAGAQAQPQPHTTQQVKPPPGLNWKPQGQAVRPRPLTRHRSFNDTYGTGQRVDAQEGRGKFERSKSMNERHTAAFKRSGFNQDLNQQDRRLF